MALDDALRTLAEFDPRQSRVVELRFFGGLSEKEVAEVLQTSERTVRREWSVAQAWLYRELQRNESGTDEVSTDEASPDEASTNE